MRLLKVSVQNFGSYEDLSLPLTDLNLCLISGATGSGKSTIMDAISWTIFGKTSKGGSSDEIKNWNTPNKITLGIVEMALPVGKLFITRSRGDAKENDLFWQENSTDSEKQRGKDLRETQQFINALLGTNFDRFSTEAYFTEFSPSATFFIAPAKARRLLFDKIVDLSLPTLLVEKITTIKKQEKEAGLVVDREYSRQLGKIDQLKTSLADTKISHGNFEAQNLENIIKFQTLNNNFLREKESKLEALQTKSYRFEADRESSINALIDKIDALDEQVEPVDTLDDAIKKAEQKAKFLVCTKCKQSTQSTNLQTLLDKRVKNYQLLEKRAVLVQKIKETQSSVNPYLESITTVQNSDNYYIKQLKNAETTVNVFSAQLAKFKAALEDNESILTGLQDRKNKNTEALSLLDQLNDLSNSFRCVLLQSAIKQVQSKTNAILSNPFDGEFSVLFHLNEADDLNVTIYKNAIECSYTQLSKGQRQLLKLAFSVSMMEAASNSSGVHSSLLMFDEALDGLDISLKLKAFNLFSELANNHESVLVIDHAPELQALFNNNFYVTMTDDNSKLEVLND